MLLTSKFRYKFYPSYDVKFFEYAFFLVSSTIVMIHGKKACFKTLTSKFRYVQFRHASFLRFIPYYLFAYSFPFIREECGECGIPHIPQYPTAAAENSRGRTKQIKKFEENAENEELRISRIILRRRRKRMGEAGQKLI